MPSPMKSTALRGAGFAGRAGEAPVAGAPEPVEIAARWTKSVAKKAARLGPRRTALRFRWNMPERLARPAGPAPQPLLPGALIGKGMMLGARERRPAFLADLFWYML